MLRDNLVGLIEPMLSSAGANPLALCTARKKPSDDRPSCLENPRPEGAESTLTENAASPFHAEPRQKACLWTVLLEKINVGHNAGPLLAASETLHLGSSTRALPCVFPERLRCVLSSIRE